VVVLYRRLNQRTWSKVELVYHGSLGSATGSGDGLSGPLEYFVQAVDAVGNVVLVLDHGQPFRLDGTYVTYLPLLRR